MADGAQESHAIFTNGDAVFVRNWTFVYALLQSPETSRVRPEQVGISTIPVAEAGRRASPGS
jgi:multiple sugar transport system substrate-binding protein